MPIYEYICNDCKNPFETLVRGSATPECPSCHGTNLEKQLSVFTQGRPALTTSPATPAEIAACGMCGDPRGPGSCSL